MHESQHLLAVVPCPGLADPLDSAQKLHAGRPKCGNRKQLRVGEEYIGGETPSGGDAVSPLHVPFGDGGETPSGGDAVSPPGSVAPAAEGGPKSPFAVCEHPVQSAQRTEVPLRTPRTPGSVRPADRSPPSQSANTRFSPPSQDHTRPKPPFYPAIIGAMGGVGNPPGCPSGCGQPPGLSKDVWAGGGQPGRVVHGLSMQPAGAALSMARASGRGYRAAAGSPTEIEGSRGAALFNAALGTVTPGGLTGTDQGTVLARRKPMNESR